MIPERFQLLIPHVVDSEDEKSIVFVDGLTNLVDQFLLEIQTNFLRHFGQSHFSISFWFWHFVWNFLSFFSFFI